MKKFNSKSPTSVSLVFTKFLHGWQIMVAVSQNNPFCICSECGQSKPSENFIFNDVLCIYLFIYLLPLCEVFRNQNTTDTVN